MSGAEDIVGNNQEGTKGTMFMAVNITDRFNNYSFEEITKLDEHISLEMKALAVQGLAGSARAFAVSERILMLLAAAPKVAESITNPDEYDVVEEIVNRWTGYLSYHKIFAPGALLPPAPTRARPPTAKPL